MKPGRSPTAAVLPIAISGFSARPAQGALGANYTYYRCARKRGVYVRWQSEDRQASRWRVRLTLRGPATCGHGEHGEGQQGPSHVAITAQSQWLTMLENPHDANRDACISVFVINV